MKRYRIIQLDVLCEGMLQEEASEALQKFKATYPDKF